MGATGILLGNLLTSILYTAAQVTILATSLGAPKLDRRLIAPLWEYGRPLIVTALLAMLMHNGDRYILRFFVDMKAIGIYSLAYVAGQGINTMLLAPFAAIWNVEHLRSRSGTRSREDFCRGLSSFLSCSDSLHVCGLPDGQAPARTAGCSRLPTGGGSHPGGVPRLRLFQPPRSVPGSGHSLQANFPPSTGLLLRDAAQRSLEPAS